MHKTRVVRRCFCARVSSFCILSIALYATRAAHLDTAFSSLYLPGVQKALWLPPRAPNLTKRSRRTTPNFAENNRRISPNTTAEFRRTQLKHSECVKHSHISTFSLLKNMPPNTRETHPPKSAEHQVLPDLRYGIEDPGLGVDEEAINVWQELQSTFFGPETPPTPPVVPKAKHSLPKTLLNNTCTKQCWCISPLWLAH